MWNEREAPKPVVSFEDAKSPLYLFRSSLALSTSSLIDFLSVFLTNGPYISLFIVILFNDFGSDVNRCAASFRDLFAGPEEC